LRSSFLRCANDASVPDSWSIAESAQHAAQSARTDTVTVFIYDTVLGGIGFSEKLYEAHDLLMKAALDHVTRCTCDDGCPSCVGVRPSDETLPCAKKTTRQLWEVLQMRAEDQGVRQPSV